MKSSTHPSKKTPAFKSRIRSTLLNAPISRFRTRFARNQPFKHFQPSQFTEREREPQRYLAPGENLAAAMTRLVHDGIDRVRNNASRQGLRVALTPEITNLMEDPGNGEMRTIYLPDFLNIITMKLPAAPALRDEPALTACAAALQAQEKIDAIEGMPAAPQNGHKTSHHTAKDHEPTTKAFVAAHAHNLLANVSSPDLPLALSPPAAADQGQVKQNILSFELRSGPSDVTAYHDFNTLQIAFEHVWAELTDDRLSQVGQEFYHSYVDLLDFLGNPVDPATESRSSRLLPSRASRTSRTLIQDASLLGRVADNAVPSGAPAGFPTKEEADFWADHMAGPPPVDKKAAENKWLTLTFPAATRLQALLEQMRDLLSSRYSFYGLSGERLQLRHPGHLPPDLGTRAVSGR